MDEGSFHRFMDGLRAGDPAGAEALFARYSQRLLALARERIGARLQQRVGAEDIVQSVFRTFFRRTQEGLFQIDHSGALWHLLVRITINKVHKQVDRHRCQKRASAAEVEQTVLTAEAFAREPTEDEVVALEEEIEFILAANAEDEVEIFRRRVAGEGVNEIAQRMQVSRWTVRRVLDDIGGRLEQRLAEYGRR